jgi:TonB family protein
MNTLFIYTVKVAVYLVAFYLVYSIMLSRDTAYGRNRAYILLSLLSALILPFITLQTSKPWNIQFFGRLLSEVFITANKGSSNELNAGSSTGILQTIYSVYLLIAAIFIFKLFTDLINLLFLIIRNRNEENQIIRFHGFNTSGFSAMGYIFISSRLSDEDAGEIIRHEQNHLKENHFIDIIFIEFIKAFQWFNPVIYLFNRSLRAIHEYQADQDCLNSGVSMVNYQSLLLSQVFKSGAFNLTNSFSNPSLIKKRMVMMTKKRTSSIANAKILIVVPIIGVVLIAISAYSGIPDSSVKHITPDTLTQNILSESDSYFIPLPPPPPPPPKSNQTVKAEKENDTFGFKKDPYVVVDEMPMFPGGDPALLKYIADNTRYPQAAKDQNLQGKVIIRFCIKADGGVNKISVLKGVAPELDAEAVRVVNSLPAFRPGKQGGKAVPVWYMVPIAFTLK